jgi:hypothetical protein
MDLQSTENLFIKNYKSHYNELAEQSVIKQMENLKNIRLTAIWQRG